ncbi:MAG: ABC transporter permease [Firmicutes bacterium]|nr:ABC transporter permease [Bacillota bacterium]MBQ3199390.1 ABC transporter permease [Bacillota bacterium]
MAFLNVLPGAIAEGLIWGLMAIGVYISYKILDIADLSVDGSICTGACVCVVMLAAGNPIWLCMLASVIAGALAGVLTGLFHTALGIPAILAGILTQLILYSVNLSILGGKSLIAIDIRSTNLIMHMSDNPMAIVSAGLIIVATIIGLWLFFYTETGLTIKSTGDNPHMSRAQGVNVDLNKVIGLAISNGIVALAGSLLAQYKGSANINDGRGAIVIGLAAIFIGLSVSLKIKPNFVCSLIGVIGGGIVYYIIYNFVILLGLKTDYLKMLSAIIVALFIAVPYLKTKYFTKQKPIPIVQNNGGDEDA